MEQAPIRREKHQGDIEEDKKLSRHTTARDNQTKTGKKRRKKKNKLQTSMKTLGTTREHNEGYGAVPRKGNQGATPTASEKRGQTKTKVESN